MNILVVDDDEKVRKATVRAVRSFGHSTQEAATGELALEVLLRASRIDAVISDINLGTGLDGVELTMRLRKIFQYKNTPVALMTGADDEFERAENECVSLKKVSVHQKPVTIRTLLDALGAS
jgi:CheY-like chemotaxis protein